MLPSGAVVTGTSKRINTSDFAKLRFNGVLFRDSAKVEKGGDRAFT
jgi:hypothetical protein